MSVPSPAAETLLNQGLPNRASINFDVACPHCAYNLRALTTHRCPECGVALDWGSVLDAAARRSGVGSLLHNGIPRWEAIDFDVMCGRCGYNLRTLTRPLCTECGLTFDWRIVLDKAAWKSDYLFEHHWRQRPLSSWFTTLWRGLQPSRFWRNVSIQDQIRPGPLWFFLFFAIVLLFLLVHGVAEILAKTLSVFGPAMPAAPAWPPVPAPSFAQNLGEQFAHLASLPSNMGWGYAMLPASITAMMLGALVTICGLRQTLGRCSVRTVHVLRLVAYASAPVSLLTAMLVLTAFAAGFVLTSLLEYEWAESLTLALGVFGPILLFAFFLRAGIKHYLRLPRAGLIALTSSFLGLLFVAAARALTSALAQGGWD